MSVVNQNAQPRPGLLRPLQEQPPPSAAPLREHCTQLYSHSYASEGTPWSFALHSPVRWAQFRASPANEVLVTKAMPPAPFGRPHGAAVCPWDGLVP
eukprot:8060533-Lingulodinium_polyedra.AAC.1